MLRLFCFLFSCALFAQELQISRSAVDYQFDAIEGKVHLVSPNAIQTIDLNRFEVVDSLPIKHTLNLAEQQFLKTKEGFYFIEKKGGQVHQLVQDSLVRVDYSFTHKMQIDASTYVQNDTIFRYGGYGFWSTRNIITYFDTLSKEWEIYPILNNTIGGIHGFVHLEKGVKKYFFAGKGIDTKNVLIETQNKELRMFDLKTKTLDVLGEIAPELLQFVDGVLVGNDFMLFNEQQSAVINFNKNSFSLSKVPKLLWQTKNLRTKRKALKPFFYKNNLWFFILRTEVDDIFLVKTPLEIFKENPVIKKGAVYVAPMNYYRIGYIALSILFIGFFISLGIVLYRRKFIWLRKNSLSYKGRILQLDDHMVEVLRLLITNTGGVTSEEILQVIQKPNLDYSYNNRLKKEFIHNLNAMLKSFLGVSKDLVESDYSAQDRRIKEYSLKESKRFKNTIKV